MKTFGMSHKGDAGASGSSTVTSSAAPLISPRCKAAISAGSSTHRPRAALTSTGERLGVDDVLRFGCEWTSQSHEIRLGQQVWQPVKPVHAVGAIRAGVRIAP